MVVGCWWYFTFGSVCNQDERADGNVEVHQGLEKGQGADKLCLTFCICWRGNRHNCVSVLNNVD